MYPDGRYNMNFDISAIFLSMFLLIIYFRSRRKGRNMSKLFMWIIYFLHITAIMDLIQVVMRNDPSCFNYYIETVSIFLSHIIHNSLACMYTMYIIRMTRTNYMMTKRQKMIFFAPEAVLIIFSVIPFLQRQLYILERDGNYIRGPLYNLYFYVVVIYFIISLYVLIRYRKALGDNLIYTWIFYGGSAASVLLSATYPYLRAALYLQTLCALGIFIAIENANTLFDNESGAMTGYALIKEAEILYTGRYTSSVISIKIPNMDYYFSIFGRSNVFELIRGITSYLSFLGGQGCNIYYPASGIITMLLYNTSEEKAVEMAETIRQRFNKKWDVPGMNVAIPMQICVTTIPDKVMNVDQLMAIAGSGYNPLIREPVYVVDGINSEKRLKSVEEAIRRGLRSRDLKVCYQPIIDTDTGSFRSAEALVRYTDEVIGAIPPEEFIRVAEHMGVIGKIGDIVFEKVCAFVAEQHPEQYGIDFISVNLSSVQCMDENLARRLTDIAGKYGTNTRRINLEISSDIFSYNEEMLERAVKGLRQSGFLISLDDFGDGDTDFENLIKHPFTSIKIDRKMLWQAGLEEKKDIILSHIIRMLKELKFTVVVEGVETEEQKNRLLKLNVEFLQGFLYSLPLSEDKFVELLKGM